MIPWMREKFAERKAKWEASRRRANFSSETIGVSDKIPLRKDVSYDSIELCDENDDVILLKIIGCDGRVAPLRLMSTTTIEEVKCQALRELVPTTDDQGTSRFFDYKLLKPTASMLTLNEILSISQSNLSDCDELLLMKCSLGDGNADESRVQKGPSQTVIDKATVERIQCGDKTESIRDVNEIMLHCDVKNDIRQILISLAKSSAFVIGAGPFAAQIILMFKERLIRRNDLCQLDTLPQCSVQKALKTETDGNNWEQKTKFLELNERFSETHFLNSSTQESTKRNIEALLEIIRIYAYKHITAKSNLKEIIWKMGFSKDDVEDALKVAANNYVDACRWLMRTHRNYNDGLLKDSPMLKALIISPHIQLSFSSPKIFIAYLSIYSSINLWLSDAETAGVIGHVLQKNLLDTSIVEGYFSHSHRVTLNVQEHKINRQRDNDGKSINSLYTDNHSASHKLNIYLNGESLTHNTPIYLGIPLDRSLTYKPALEQRAKKLSARNNLIQKLTGTNWGANGNVLRTAVLSLVYSVAEYGAPVWYRNSHTDKVDVQLNIAMRKITGTVDSTPLPWLHVASNIEPPNLRRKLAAHNQWAKCFDILRTYDLPIKKELEHPPQPRLVSRLPIWSDIEIQGSNYDINGKWKEFWDESPSFSNKFLIENPHEKLAGFELPRREWKMLNRFRTGHGCCGEQLYKWKYRDSPNCDCNTGVIQSMDHILNECPFRKFNGDLRTLSDATHEAIDWLKHLDINVRSDDHELS